MTETEIETETKNPRLSVFETETETRSPVPRADLERLQLVSTRFDDVIESSVKLSEDQGPLRVVTKIEFGEHPCHPKRIAVWLRDGTRVACTSPRYKNLAERLKFSVVQKLRVARGGLHNTDIQDLSQLLPVKATWKNATAGVSMSGFASRESVEFAFTQLLLCKEIILYHGSADNLRWSPRYAYMRLPTVADCNVLNLSGLDLCDIQPVVEWLEHDVPREKCSEPRQMILKEARLIGGIEGLLTALKTAFLASSSPKPYVVRIRQYYCRYL